MADTTPAGGAGHSPGVDSGLEIGRHVGDRHVEDDGRRLAVDVRPLAERLDERGIAAQVRQHAQFDLRVVRGHEQEAVVGNEAAPYVGADLGADRDVLEVRVRGREPTRRRDGLVEARVQPSRPRVHEDRQRVHVRAAQLVQLAVLDDAAGEGVPQLGQLLQHGRIRRRPRLGLLQHREVQLVEQDLPELGRRVDVELLAGHHPDVVRDVRELALELLRHRVEEVQVDPDARLLHVREHVDERHLDVPEQRLEVVLPELRFQPPPQPLQVRPQIFRVGEFKSAVEPFLMEKMSQENRLQLNELANGIYDHMLTKISEARNIDRQRLEEISDQMLVRNAPSAVTLGLVDSLLYRDQFLDILKDRLDLGADDFAVVEGDPNLQLIPQENPNSHYIGMTNTFEPWGKRWITR